MTTKYDDYETGNEFDASCTHALQSQPYQRPVSAISAQYQRPAHAAYPTVNLSGYDVPCPTYHDYQVNQIHEVHVNPQGQHNLSFQYDEQALNQMYSGPAIPINYHNTLPFRMFCPELNKVFVFDGNLWNEFNLEKVFS